LPILVTVLTGVALLLAGLGVASFNNGNSSGFSVASDRIFPAAHTTPAFVVTDASTAAASDSTFSTAVGESRNFTTGNWITTFSATRYVDFPLSAPLPGGLATSSVSFSFDFADDVVGQTACIYFEVYQAGSSTLIGTHGSSGAPVQCVTGTGLTHTSTALAEVTTTDIANDLKIRVYAKESGNTAIRIDLAAVTDSSYAGFTLYPTAVGDRSTTVLSTTTWGLAAAGDAATLNSGTWATTFSATRYITFSFPDEAPTSATVTAASFALSYRAGTNGSNSCWYFEVYNGSGTLIGTHGSSGATISCNSSNVTYQTDTVTLAEVDTGPELNGLQVKVYFKTSGPSTVRFDLAQLSETYSLGTGSGCASAGLTTIDATGDTYVDQASAGTNFGNSATASVQTRNLSRNRRMLVYFPMPPVPTGCSVTLGTLRIYASAVAGARTMEAWQVSSIWTERAVTWTTQPTTTGVAATSANGAGYESWTVTALVTSMEAGGNYGFQVKDQTESSASAFAQTYRTTEAITNVPQLDVTFG
jgi:hypothetical protein